MPPRGLIPDNLPELVEVERAAGLAYRKIAFKLGVSMREIRQVITGQFVPPSLRRRRSPAKAKATSDLPPLPPPRPMRDPEGLGCRWVGGSGAGLKTSYCGGTLYREAYCETHYRRAHMKLSAPTGKDDDARQSRNPSRWQVW